jgi:hypothetical protein
MAACDATPGPRPGSAPPAVAGRAPSTASFATQIAGPATYLAPMPTAVVVLKPDDMARNRAFCDAFNQLPTVEESLMRSVVAPNLIYTRWLTQLSEMPGTRVHDCEFLVGTYDYARAKALMATIHVDEPLVRVGTIFDRRGPFLLLMIPDASGIHIAGIDGSNYDQADFGLFVASWGRAMNSAQAEIASQAQAAARPGNPDHPGLMRSVFDLVFAVLRTAFVGPVALIQGTLNTL